MRLPIVAVMSFDIPSIRPIYRNFEQWEELFDRIVAAGLTLPTPSDLT
jgi:hypothetical protein